MSTPYPPQPRRLMRDPSNKLIGGVCSGLAKYLNMDVNLVRILTVVISLFTGIPIVLYIIALFVMPEERKEQQPPYVNGPQPGAYGAGAAQSYQQPAYGAPASAQPANDVWGAEGAPWEQPQTAAPASTPATPAPEAWQQPSSWQATPEPPAQPTAAQPTAAEPTVYEDAPAEPAASESLEDAPATAAPEQTPTDAPAPEPLPESEVARPAEQETSTWETAPADPTSSADPDEDPDKKA